MVKVAKPDSQLIFDQMCQVYVRVFRFITVLPFEGRDFSFIYTRLLTCYMICSSMVHWSMFTFYCFTASSLKLDDICTMSAVIGLNYRYYMMLYRREAYTSLFNECRALWNFCTEEGQQTVMYYENKIYRACQIFFFSCLFINVMYPVDALMTRLPPLEENGTERRIMPFNWFGENTENKGLGYWPNFCIQIIINQLAIFHAVFCDAAIPLLMMISSGYFRHLRDRLFASHENPKLSGRELVRCIVFHQRLLTFCVEITKFANVMFLTYYLSTGYNISLILFKLASSDADKYKYLAALSAAWCQLFLIHWAPEGLLEESEGVSFGAYSAYLKTIEKSQLGQHWLIIMRRAQRPVQVLVVGIIPLSLKTFSMIIKSAFSFFTVLQQANL